VILACRTVSDAQNISYALLEVTSHLLGDIAERVEGTNKLFEGSPSLYTVSFWDSSLSFLRSLPEEWEEEAGWCELENELDEGEWVELPFLSNLQGLEFSRTECDLMHITRSAVFWSAIPKHSSYRLETPYFPELSPLEQLALTDILERA